VNIKEGKKVLHRLSKAQKVFLTIFILLNLYFLVIKSELYESRTEIIVKDLSTATNSSSLGLSLLGMGASSQLQDSRIVEAYLKSLDVYTLVDQKFHLTEHYKSDALDFIERLDDDATREEVLEFYNTRLNVFYDETSGILTVAFAHVDKTKTKEILEFLVKQVEEQINEFNRSKARKQLKFVQIEFDKAKKKMDDSSQKLEAYQNRHLLLDPDAEASASSGMISQLEASLLEKKIKYSTMSSYLKEDTYELKTLKKEIEEISRSIEKERQALTGTSGDELNKVLFEYGKLKLQFEFDTEVYKNALIQLESTKIDVVKAAKTLSILSRPNLPDGYTYPDKPRVFTTILIVTLLLYGIFAMLGSIIRDHKE
jgi:capsular polysaccharide transport system permease protein